MIRLSYPYTKGCKTSQRHRGRKSGERRRYSSQFLPLVTCSPRFPARVRRQCLGLSVARMESEDAAGSFLRFPGQGKGEVVTKS